VSSELHNEHEGKFLYIHLSNKEISNLLQFTGVRIATGYGLDETSRISSPDRVKNFLFFTSSRPALRPTYFPMQWVPRFLSPEVKRPGPEAYHSPETSTEVKKTWSYTST
jgi:hypothetical protein